MTAPVTGTYTLVFDPDDAYGVTGNGSVTVNDVPRDITGRSLPAVRRPLLRSGRRSKCARDVFRNGKPARRVDKYEYNDPLQRHYDPGSGWQRRHLRSTRNNGTLGPVYLPLAGQYGVLVNPFDWYTGAMTLTLYNVDPDISQEVPTDGTPTTFTPTPFQTVLLTTIAPASPDGPLSIPTSVPRPGEAEKGMQCG
jgi:hypothetical protein